ncbi:MAG: RHS repeat-associated core domain-containing protein [Lachnospiraceae bacterium]|nr:RHS repeat-associated core domain-containing protein [Lachnospiraceae bacterium]
MVLTYDAMGHVKNTKVQNTASSANKTITTSAEYTTNGEYLASQTDATGSKTTYKTNDIGLTESVTDALSHKTAYGYNTKNDRLTSVTLDDGTAATYTYANGVLDSIVRSSLLPDGATKVSQKYGFTYDIYDNVTSVKVGNKTLVSYTYMAHNGPLKKITYGNGSTVEYGYDVLGRVITEKRDGTLKYRYVYSSEGDLSRKEEVDSSGKVIKATCYEYDSLDRLIRSWEEVQKSGALRREVLTEHTYDTSNRIKKQSWQTGDGTSRSETYTYNNKDGTLSKMKTASGREITLMYDYLKRLQSKTDGARTAAYSYKNTGSTGTTTQVEKIAWSGMGTNDLAFGYTYDKLGNIIKVTHNDQTVAEYTYNVQSQLLTAKLPQSNQEYTYSYDTGGNIRSIKENNNGTETTKTFRYTDSDWKDLLTAVDGHSLTYDTCGNPLTYYNGKDWTFTWKEGRRLAAAKSGTTSVSYTYDAEGMRTSKTIDGVKHNYVYLGDLLVEETWGNNTLRFSYDEQNRPYSVQYNSNLYYYVLNQQGDVIRLVNGDGVIRGEYTYDAWGNILKVTATAEIGNVNPLRYRGYVYDSETGFYYVGSRYYDAENCRFISADDTELLTTTMDDITDKNLYAYCDNDPINRVDEKGDIWKRYVLVRFIPLNPPVFIAACVVYVGLSYLARKYVKARKNGFSITGWLRANARRPKLSNGGRKARDSSKNERHGDSGRALEKAKKQTDKLDKELKNATSRREKKKINNKKKNINKKARKERRGENHSMKQKR